ncbi:MAG: glycosyl transferase family 28 [Rhodospirillales bacterium]|nr:glycosyl transferase family 28 [Rhodospirillales bacterium]
MRSLDETFSILVDDGGRRLNREMRAQRRDRLLALFEDCRPRVVLTEMFPFGRRQMRFELLPLLDAALQAPWKPKITCSVRDILNTLKQPGKIAWIVETAQRYYDRVLVHGDPALIPFERTFPAAAALGDRIRYTGYVVNAAIPARRAEPDGEILVSTGGGAVAGPLVRGVLEAHPLSSLRHRHWRILIGPNLPEAPFRAFQAEAPPGMTVERSRPDFPELLCKAHLSISQAGYNTTLEVLSAGVPAVVVPFAAGGETEQSLRARLLAESGRLVLAEEASLTGHGLSAAMERALSLVPKATAPSVALDGAAETARRLAALAEG